MSADYITRSGYTFTQIRKLTLAKDEAELQVECGQKDIEGSSCKETIYRPLTPEDKFDHSKKYCFGREGAWVHPCFDRRGRVSGMTRYGSNDEDEVMHHLADSMSYVG